MHRMEPEQQVDRATVLGSLAVLPLLVWWLGWFPGFMTSDSIDQLGQVHRFEFSNFHPAFHTLYLWLVTRVWDSPGAVSLVQVLLLAALLGYAARRLVEVGVPGWLGVGTAWLIALLPAVAPTTLAIWKDVPFTLALVWAFVEVLGMARDRNTFWRRRWPPLRLGLALSLMWLFRHNGLLTVVLFLALLAVVERRCLRRLIPTAATIGGVLVLVLGVGYRVLPVDTTSIPVAEVFYSDVAASLVHEPDNFSQEELEYLATIAPLDVWNAKYRCEESTSLVFDARFDHQIVRSDPGRFQEIALKTLLRDPETVLGHRWCLASFLLIPDQPDAPYGIPPFLVAENDAGYVRDPISWRVFQATKTIYAWAEPPERFWLTWRPALPLWLAAMVYAGIAWRPPLRPLLLPGALLAAHIINVAATTPAQEFRYAFGIYLMSWLTIPLARLVWRPAEAALVLGKVRWGGDDGDVEASAGSDLDPHRTTDIT